MYGLMRFQKPDQGLYPLVYILVGIFFSIQFFAKAHGDVVLILKQTETTVELTGIISLINFILPILIVPLVSFWFVFRIGKREVPTVFI